MSTILFAAAIFLGVDAAITAMVLNRMSKNGLRIPNFMKGAVVAAMTISALLLAAANILE